MGFVIAFLCFVFDVRIDINIEVEVRLFTMLMASFQDISEFLQAEEIRHKCALPVIG